jgi:hypothetical protein
VIDPFVSISVYGIPADTVQEKTRTVTNNGKTQSNFLFRIGYLVSYTNASHTHKNAQVVTNLQQTGSNAVPTTCQQDVFALLVPSLLTQRLADNLPQGC